MTDTTDRARVARRSRHEAIRAEVAEEEAEAANAEVAEKAGTLDVPLHLRIDRELDAQLRQRAAAAQIPTSVMVRRLLRQAVHEPRVASSHRRRARRPPTDCGGTSRRHPGPRRRSVRADPLREPAVLLLMRALRRP